VVSAASFAHVPLLATGFSLHFELAPRRLSQKKWAKTGTFADSRRLEV
jgi:hypothetical protein